MNIEKIEWKMIKFRDCGLSRMFLIMKAFQLGIIDIAKEFNNAVAGWEKRIEIDKKTQDDFMFDILWVNSVGRVTTGLEFIHYSLILAYTTFIDNNLSERLYLKCNMRELKEIELRGRKKKFKVDLSSYGELGFFCDNLFLNCDDSEWDDFIPKLSLHMRNLLNYMINADYDGTPETSTYQVGNFDTDFMEKANGILLTSFELDDKPQDRDLLAEEIKNGRFGVFNKVYKSSKQFSKYGAVSLFPLTSVETLEKEYGIFQTYYNISGTSKFDYHAFLLSEIIIARGLLSIHMQDKFEMCIDTAEYMAKTAILEKNKRELSEDNSRKERLINKLTKTNEQILKSNNELKSSKENAVKLAIESTENKYKSRIEELEVQLIKAQNAEKKILWEENAINEARNTIEELEDKAKAQEQMIKELCDTLAHIEEDCTISIDDWTVDKLKEVVGKRRIIVTGGSDSWRKRVTDSLESVNIRVTAQSLSKVQNIVQNLDTVIFNRRMSGHSDYYGMVSACISKNVRIIFVDNENVTLSLKHVYKKLIHDNT